MPKNLHKGKSSIGPKSNGSETPVMPCHTSVPFILSNKSFDRGILWLSIKKGKASLERIPDATIQQIGLLMNLQ